MRRRLIATAATAAALPVLVVSAAPAGACGGLVGENGTIELVRTTTLAAYSDGIERYVTAFEFTGEGEEVGSIIPLPGRADRRDACRRLDAPAPRPGGGATGDGGRRRR